MNGPVTFVRVHEPDAVREIIAEADEIARAYSSPDDVYDVIFSKAVDLLAARTVLQMQPQPVGFDLSQIDKMRRM